MLWRIELGEQIRRARASAKMSQEALSAEISARFAYPYTRAQISNIEKGKSSAPVNIITAIAEVLHAQFEVGGCRIGERSEPTIGQLTLMPKQLSLQFDVEYQFSSSSLKLTSTPEDSVSLQAVFTRGAPKPLQIIDAGKPRSATA